jgi:branched-subunit amino acid ABC-type transport system permease component
LLRPAAERRRDVARLAALAFGAVFRLVLFERLRPGVRLRAAAFRPVRAVLAGLDFDRFVPFALAISPVLST